MPPVTQSTRSSEMAAQAIEGKQSTTGEDGKILIPLKGEEIEAIKQLNIKLCYAQTLFYTLYQSICMWNVFDAYVNILAKQSGSDHANTWVGVAESMNGIATLIFAIPCGIMSDKYDRTVICKYAAFLGFFSSFLSACGFMYDNWTVIFAAMWSWGFFASLTGTSAEAVFADSCPTGERSEQTAFKGTLQSAGLALGPLLMYGIFAVYGDTWDLQVIHVPLLAGCVLAPLAALPLLFMKDLRNYKLATHSDGLESGLLQNNTERDNRRSTNAGILRERGFTVTSMGGGSIPANDVEDGKLGRNVLNSMSRPRGDSVFVDQRLFIQKNDQELEAKLDSTDIQAMIRDEEQRFANMTKWERSVPYFLTIADFIMEMGAGMTVRFFALFFMNDFDVTPKGMSLIFGLYPLFVAASTMLAQKLSLVTGRAQISWFSQFLGIFALLSMAAIADLTLLIVVFFIRAALQNGAYPVDRSILYDYIPSSRRGKWASIASLLTMTWSGSAIIGGYLADENDYRYTFIVTAGIYAVGLVVYTPLLWLVPRREQDLKIN